MHNRFMLRHLPRAALLALLVTTGGSATACDDKGSTKADIQSELDHNPALKDKGYTVTVASFDHGFLTLAVKGLRQSSVTYLKKGETLGDITMHGEWNARALSDAGEALKKRPDVKGVRWVPAT